MVWVSLALFIVLIVVMVVTLRFGVVRLGTVLGQATANRHHAAESILETGRVPPEWVTPRPPDDPSPGGDPTEAEARSYLRRLDQLIKYFRKAPVFDGESTRAMLLDGLTEARERWSQGIWTR